MKKFLFLFYSLILINFSLSENLDLYSILESFYDYIPSIIKGYENNDNSKCADTFSNEKEKILEFIKLIFESVKNGTDLIRAIGQIAFQKNIASIINDCTSLINLVSKVLQIINKIENLGFSMIKNAKNITNSIEELTNTKDIKCTDRKSVV